MAKLPRIVNLRLYMYMYIYNCLDTPGSWQPNQIKLIVKQGNNILHALPVITYATGVWNPALFPPPSL